MIKSTKIINQIHGSIPINQSLIYRYISISQSIKSDDLSNKPTDLILTDNICRRLTLVEMSATVYGESIAKKEIE